MVHFSSYNNFTFLDRAYLNTFKSEDFFPTDLQKFMGNWILAVNCLDNVRKMASHQTILDDHGDGVKCNPRMICHKVSFYGILWHMPDDIKCHELCQYGYQKKSIDQTNWSKCKYSILQTEQNTTPKYKNNKIQKDKIHIS